MAPSMDPIRECKTCNNFFNDVNSIRCEYCREYLCNLCFKQGFFLRKSIFCVITFRVSGNENHVDVNRLQNDDFIFACSHFCQFRLARTLMTNH